MLNTLEHLRVVLDGRKGEPRTRHQKVLNAAQHGHPSVGKLLEVQAGWDHSDREVFDEAVVLLEEVGRWRHWEVAEMAPVGR